MKHMWQGVLHTPGRYECLHCGLAVQTGRDGKEAFEGKCPGSKKGHGPTFKDEFTADHAQTILESIKSSWEK